MKKVVRNDGSKLLFGDFIFTFTRTRAGLASDAFAKIDDHTEAFTLLPDVTGIFGVATGIGKA